MMSREMRRHGSLWDETEIDRGCKSPLAKAVPWNLDHELSFFVAVGNYLRSMSLGV